jgi:hypothetical protein
MPIEILPTGAALGAEIRGVDLARPPDDATFAAIECAFDAPLAAGILGCLGGLCGTRLL